MSEDELSSCRNRLINNGRSDINRHQDVRHLGFGSAANHTDRVPRLSEPGWVSAFDPTGYVSDGDHAAQGRA